MWITPTDAARFMNELCAIWTETKHAGDAPPSRPTLNPDVDLHDFPERGSRWLATQTASETRCAPTGDSGRTAKPTSCSDTTKRFARCTPSQPASPDSH